MSYARCVLGRVSLLVAGLGLAAAAPAEATIDNLKSYKQAYPGKDPKAYSCKVCHQGAIGKKGDLNAYGAALQKLATPIDSKKLKPEDYKAVETVDADEDGASNLDEITAGTDPSDPASAPEGTKQEGQGDKGTTGTGTEEVKPQSRAPDGSSALRAYLEQLVTPSAWADAPPASEESEPQPAASEPPKAAYVGAETCAACHAQQFKEFQQSTHARISVPGEDAKWQGCEMCHGPGSLH
ncbi:MAG: hypothetical protein HY599_06010, partial [Candidatus Omnitrophica bacterium]|nr:hypothetical protein [Candidatus Omnitrophota bacterium]